MKRQTITITEGQLRQLIRESVERILLENEQPEGYTNGDWIVADDNKIGYVIGNPTGDGVGIRMAVVAVDVENGGDPNLVNRSTSALRKNIRKATTSDEMRFRVRIGD